MSRLDIDNLELDEVIRRALYAFKDDVTPLYKYLEIPEEMKGNERMIANYLREMGSNDIATFFRGGDVVSYNEVVYDVGKKIGAENIIKGDPAYLNEARILKKIFTSILENMTIEERKELIQNLDLGDTSSIDFGSVTSIIGLMAGRMAGFTTYKIAVIVANFVAKALLGRGLAFATNAAITRTIGIALGPLGWIASGAWLAIDIAGPAFRKTVPAVVHIAVLRTMLKNRITIGVVGDGSTGKDALLKYVFDIDTKNISPIAGATTTYQEYEVYNNGIYLINYPGFNDTRPEVRDEVGIMIPQTDLFIMVSDISRGISNVDKEILEHIHTYNKPILICANKIDLPRPKDLEKLKERAKNELHNSHKIIFTAFDPDPRLGGKATGKLEIKHWLIENLEMLGKNTENIKK